MAGEQDEVTPAGGLGTRPVLDPLARISEVLFGLIMALTFTGSINVAESGNGEIRTLLYGALGCNLAWGIVDAVMHLMACLGERGAAWRTARAFLDAGDPRRAREVLASALPPSLAASLDEQALESMRVAAARDLVPPPRPRLHADDWRGALGVFLLVSLSTLPVALPFAIGNDPTRALRASNAIALVMLFGLGHAFGRVAGLRPIPTGLAMVALGVVLVAITMALGG
jgi:hypothetical protein